MSHPPKPTAETSADTKPLLGLEQQHGEKITLSCMVNGQARSITSYPMARLLDVLRDDLRLTGTKEGCGEGECGACSVFIDGVLVNSCLVPIIQVEGARLVTIEGVAPRTGEAGPGLHRVQDAFLRCGGAQCGICTPGMIMATLALLREQPQPSLAEVRTGLAGNLCRCTGYTKIFDAVLAAANGAETPSLPSSGKGADA